MKIAIRGGHTFSVPGARAILDETTEDRKVKDAIVKYLKKTNHTVLDVTPNDSYNTVNKEISYGINKANDWGADVFLSIHFNKAYDEYDGAIGTEVLVYESSRENKEAKAVLNNIVSLGFKSRGIKERKDLSELKRTNMNSMIVEVCFVEATKDVELYKKVGYDKIGFAIAEALAGKINEVPEKPIVPDKPTVPEEKPKPNENWITSLQKELNKSYGANLSVDGIGGPKTLKACPILKKGNKGEIVKILQNRLMSIKYSCGESGADGIFGTGTENAVLKFQNEKGIGKDGIVGGKTWAKLLNVESGSETESENWITSLQKELNKSYGANLSVDGIGGPKTLKACPILKKGNKGGIVKILQKRLIQIGFPCGSYGADGNFGGSTKSAVANYQKSKKISADGIVGNNTWSKLLGV
ncbi:MAG: peptidoglycan-binding protein [Clostridium sp.]|uniref:peptidoglycan-binding protein n=1 Tax=Clostridium sp. TaxID=1506 RepID=UPI003EE46593